MSYDKTEMNAFVQSLYDKKMAEGKHGHYETMFHVVHKAIERAAPAAMPVGELTDEQFRSIAEAVGDEMWPDSADVGWTDDDTKFSRRFFERSLAAASTQPVRDPLTEEQRKELWHGTIEAHSKWSAYAWFSYGIRQAEAAHGIK